MNFCSAVKLQKMSSDIHFPYAEFIGCRPIQFEHRMVIDGGMQGKEASLHVDPRKSLGQLGISEGDIKLYVVGHWTSFEYRQFTKLHAQNTEYI